MLFHRKQIDATRRAVAAVEFAFVAPILITIALGLIQITRIYDAQNLLETAAREGARFAAMDRNGMLEEGESANEKMIQDVTNFMKSVGIDAEDVDVSITHADDPNQPFDLDDPANDLELFEVAITVPFSAVSYTPVSPSHDYGLTGSIVFRNGRATLSQ